MVYKTWHSAFFKELDKLPEIQCYNFLANESKGNNTTLGDFLKLNDVKKILTEELMQQKKNSRLSREGKESKESLLFNNNMEIETDFLNKNSNSNFLKQYVSEEMLDSVRKIHFK